MIIDELNIIILSNTIIGNSTLIQCMRGNQRINLLRTMHALAKYIQYYFSL